jgi:hypothetical protein
MPIDAHRKLGIIRTTWRRSSVVEQGTHKPLVVCSNHTVATHLGFAPGFFVLAVNACQSDLVDPGNFGTIALHIRY